MTVAMVTTQQEIYKLGNAIQRLQRQREEMAIRTLATVDLKQNPVPDNGRVKATTWNFMLCRGLKYFVHFGQRASLGILIMV